METAVRQRVFRTAHTPWASEALQQYAIVNPNEPNPQDSLGEALMAGGQFADAEAAFRKAVALSPAFSVAWEGVAYAKAFQRDWAARP
jgi:cytochrome c-type biogenesis protein CcmH/NrfG